ncbi:unnamed protein product [Effrenium voratum]|nr:unnamed protein product [Effrenium voratum]
MEAVAPVPEPVEVPEAVVEVSEAEAPAPVPVPADPACGEWQLLQPYLASSVEEVVLPGSVRSLAKERLP